MINLYKLTSTPSKLHNYNTYGKLLTTWTDMYEYFCIPGNKWPIVSDYTAKEIQSIEHIICTTPHAAMMYASYVIKCESKFVEEAIKHNATYSYNYAYTITKRRFIEGEPAIMEDPYVACRYAINVMQERWLEYEPILQQTYYSVWRRYCKHFNIPL